MSRGTTAGGRTHHAFLRLVSVKKESEMIFNLLLEVLFGFSSILTYQRRSKNMYFEELNRLLRFTFSTTNHRIFPYDCLAARVRYGAFVFCHRTEF